MMTSEEFHALTLDIREHCDFFDPTFIEDGFFPDLDQGDLDGLAADLRDYDSSVDLETYKSVLLWFQDHADLHVQAAIAWRQMDTDSPISWSWDEAIFKEAINKAYKVWAIERN